MDMATLGLLATKAAVNCSPIIGRKLLTRYQRNEIANEADEVVPEISSPSPSQSQRQGQLRAVP